MEGDIEEFTPRYSAVVLWIFGRDVEHVISGCTWFSAEAEPEADDFSVQCILLSFKKDLSLPVLATGLLRSCNAKESFCMERLK